MNSEQAGKNTDKEIWRKVEGDYYSPSIFVTESGGIGINVGGSVVIKPIEDWHELAKDKVIAIEEIDWAEIKRLITNYYPAFEGEVGQKNKRQLLESIRALIESKAEVRE